MKNISIEYIKDAVSGELLQGIKNIQISGVSIDSRSIKKGEIFFAIIGEVFDGHDFIKDAVKNGATAIVVDRDLKINESINIIKVKDTSIALQNLARSYRLDFLKRLLVVGITGSAGKTSTKDMLASVMNVGYKTKKTKGNFNNYYGLPLTILSFNGDEEVVVLEMGMSNLGEIRLLADIAKPQIGVITNVGEAHLESLGSIENIARAKSELIESLPADGLAVLNYDNEYVRKMKKVFKGEKIIYYGLSKEADIFADNIKSDSNGKTEFLVDYQGDKYKYQIERTGKHNVYNALAVIAVAKEHKLSNQQIQKGLSQIEYSALRWELKENIRGFKIINDAYNANPLSMRAAIEAVEELEYRKLILVLGSMLELGKREKSAHRDLGKYIASRNIDCLITIGDIADDISNSAIDNGMDINKTLNFKEKKNAVNYIEKIAKKDDLILVKGSRGNKMEEIVNELLR